MKNLYWNNVVYFITPFIYEMEECECIIKNIFHYIMYEDTHFIHKPASALHISLICNDKVKIIITLANIWPLSSV